MQPRHVLAGRVRGDELGLDLVERQRRGVDDARARRAMRQQLAAARSSRHRGRPGSARSGRGRAGDQVGRAGPGADEMHGHGAASVAGERAGDRPDDDARQNQPRLRPAGGERRRLGDRRHAGQRQRRALDRVGAARATATSSSACATHDESQPARRGGRGDARLVALALPRSPAARCAPAAGRRARAPRRAPRRSRRPTRPCGSRSPPTIMASPTAIASPASPAASRSLPPTRLGARQWRCAQASPPSAAWRAISSASVSSVTALATSRPPGLQRRRWRHRARRRRWRRRR